VKLALIGYPAGHSLSPRIHHHFMAQAGIAGSYGIIEDADIHGALARVRDGDYDGFNVTIPHKRAVMDACDTLDDTARAIGAVNTVVRRDGAWRGHNTDAAGFMAALPAAADLSRVVMLGAGGAARAILYGLRAAGADRVVLCNRTIDRARALADSFGADVAAWADRDRVLGGATLLVNATALGMAGQGALSLDLRDLPSAALVCDIVYRPRQTALLRAAADKGCRTVDGTGMLLHQAAAAFVLWTGFAPVVDEDLQRLIGEEK
jgi:shikimate dehydrogenase